MDVLWPDASVELVEVTYDEVRLTVREDSGRRRVVIGRGPIGVDQLGIWDETIVESAVLRPDHPFATRCWSDIQARGVNGTDSGSPDRNLRRFQTLEVVLIDGSRLMIAAASFEATDPLEPEPPSSDIAAR